jgi:hypothetical protein
MTTSQTFLERYAQIGALDQQKNEFIEVSAVALRVNRTKLTHLPVAGTLEKNHRSRKFLSAGKTRP